MKVSDFAVEVTKEEGKKRQVSIAQVNEILRVINDLTHGDFYRLVQGLDKVIPAKNHSKKKLIYG
jgi:hypothetical protein